MTRIEGEKTGSGDNIPETRKREKKKPPEIDEAVNVVKKKPPEIDEAVNVVMKKPPRIDEAVVAVEKKEPPRIDEVVITDKSKEQRAETMCRPEYLQKGRVMEERQNIDPTFDEAVSVYSETTGVNQDVQISGLGMSNCNPTSECPREVKSRVQSQLSCEVVRVTVVQDQGECRVPGAGTAMQPCNQNLMERGISKEYGECRVPGAGTAMQPCNQNLMERGISKEYGECRAPGAWTAMRPYQQNLMKRGVSKEHGEERAPDAEAALQPYHLNLCSHQEEPKLRLSYELRLLGAVVQKAARAPTLHLRLVNCKLKAEVVWNYEVNILGLTVRERYGDQTLYEKGRGNSDTNRMVRRRKAMEEKEVTRKKSRSSRQLQEKQPDESGIYKLDQTGVGGGPDSTFWEKITRFMRSRFGITYAVQVCGVGEILCTLGDMQKKPDSVRIGGSEEQRRTSVLYTHTADCNITQSHTETCSENFKYFT